jgi:KUP system potassium uptake protein
MLAVPAAHAEPPRGRPLVALSLGALGVVYGDVGTSPLYALRACFQGPWGAPLTPANLLGVLSLVFWSLLVVISFKYLGIVMRAHNRGEGGILALMALLPGRRRGGRGRATLVVLGLFGAALLYGDGMITPAISVLSAVEGLHVATPVLAPYVVPITVVILLGLFSLQRRGTARIAAVFGPLTLAWFTALAALGVGQVVREPSVVAALDPRHALGFFGANGGTAFLTLGGVFLVVTGAEALYADMGHFGPRPIRLAWFTVVLPALVLNYLGQGALLLRDSTAIENPFFRMVPALAYYPMVALATVATIIASQAVISGAFSLTRQAVQLGYCPRVQVTHTSPRAIGQIYVPAVNALLMAGTVALVLGFRSSEALAGAYGIAVSATMGITTILLASVAVDVWRWRPAAAGLLVGGFLAIDAAFLGANLLKIAAGGWVSVLVAGAVFVAMTTWRRGRLVLAERLRELTPPDDVVVRSLGERPPVRVPGTAVFLDRTREGVPAALLHNVKHNKVLHERVVLLTVATDPTPTVPDAGRWAVRHLGYGFHRMVVRYGFMETPDLPALLATIDAPPLALRPLDTTYFLSRDTILTRPGGPMPLWQARLFAFMSRNARSAADFFHLPPNRVVELGARIEL